MRPATTSPRERIAAAIRSTNRLLFSKLRTLGNFQLHANYMQVVTFQSLTHFLHKTPRYTPLPKVSAPMSRSVSVEELD